MEMYLTTTDNVIRARGKLKLNSLKINKDLDFCLNGVHSTTITKLETQWSHFVLHSDFGKYGPIDSTFSLDYTSEFLL